MCIHLHIFQHSDRFVKRTKAIVGRVAVLLQEIIFNQFGDFQSNFIAFGQRRFADQLHNFRQIFFFLQNFFRLKKKINFIIKF